MGKNSPSQKPTVKTWRSMLSRCNNTNDKDYPNIGGKGIKVHAPWLLYENFLADMGERPEEHYLRRLDESADFCPTNVVWEKAVNAATNPVYGIWKGIRRRCGLIGVAHKGRRRHYMDRGVTMSPIWAEDFWAFYKDVGERPSPAHSLDRIDNNAGYYPGNVRWTLIETQQNNRCDNIYIEVDGARKTLSQWARHYGLTVATLQDRFGKLFLPAAPRKQSVIQCDVTGLELARYESVKDAAAKTGISRAALQKCLCGGNATAGGYRWSYGN